MSPARWFARVRREPYFLVRSYALEAAGLALLVALLAPRARTELLFHPAHALLPLLAVPFGWWISAVLHGAAHSSYRGPGAAPGRPDRIGAAINRVLGALSGAWVGYGFSSFILIHALHHAHADERHDPVCPREMTFARFWSGPMRHATRRAVGWLDETHGQRPGYRWARLGAGALFHLNLALRVAALYLLLGPEVFLCFYVPSIVSNVSILAHINFACHRDSGDGSVEIVNLDHNLYYRLANFVTSGGYYHRAHHLHPGVRDPRRVSRAEDVSLTRPATPGGRAAWKRYFDVAGIWGER